MKVVAWNMHQRSLYGNWPVLRDDPKLGGAHVALLCEATGVPELPSRFGFHAEGNGSTKRSDCECSDLPYGCHKRRYSTAIATTDERANGLREIPDGPRPSRPGTWTARTVAVGNATVTAIALYGLHDGSYVASVRRSLKELSPIIEDDEYGRYLLLGGDLNVLAGKPARTPAWRSSMSSGSSDSSIASRPSYQPGATTIPHIAPTWTTVLVASAMDVVTRARSTRGHVRRSPTRTTTYSPHRGSPTTGISSGASRPW